MFLALCFPKRFVGKENFHIDANYMDDIFLFYSEKTNP